MQIHWIKNNADGTSIGLAEISVSEDEPIANQNPDLKELHPKKKMEFYASRQLIKQMCEALEIPFHGIDKDEFGKPHLIKSNLEVSISHSFPLVVAAIHPSASCGIDIEGVRPQLHKIKHKFLNQKELEYCGEDLKSLCLHWSAKETLYKIYGRKRLLFAEQMAITAITENQIEGQIYADGLTTDHKLYYEYHEDYLIVNGI